MKIDMVRYFVMATLESANVSYSNMPDDKSGTYDSWTTVYSESGSATVHETVKKAKYQAITRGAKDTETATEAIAQKLYDAVHNLANLKKYDGIYLSAAMDATTDPVTFAPDDNGGTPATKAASFNTNDYILIGLEIIKVSSVASPNVTASRAKFGTVKAIHADNSEVFNITRNPIPGEICQSTTTGDSTINWLGYDDKLRPMFSVNWEVTLK